MSNQALPQVARQLVEQYQNRCQNLGLILDKYAPWGQDNRGNWDLVMRESIRRQGQTTIQPVSGGQAKGLWISPTREAKNGESESLFASARVDIDLMQAKQKRWVNMVQRNSGIAFQIDLMERMAAGLGASHVLETGLTLDRNTGLPYLPGSSAKGLARAWGLIEVASQLNVQLTDENSGILNELAEILISEPTETLSKKVNMTDNDVLLFRYIFGHQNAAGAVCFLDGIYYGNDEPSYAADVMTPHYVKYYTSNGSDAASEDDNPNPVSFLTVDKGNRFAFGVLPRLAAFQGNTSIGIAPNDILGVAKDWLVKALSQLGAGSKTASGYGFFSRKSEKAITQ